MCSHKRRTQRVLGGLISFALSFHLVCHVVIVPFALTSPRSHSDCFC